MPASCRAEVKVNLAHRLETAGPRAGREDSQEELVCGDLARSRPSTAQGRLVKACQCPDENPGADEGLNLLGVTLALPAIQSIELPRDYSWAEQAIAKRWAASQASPGTLSLFFGSDPVIVGTLTYWATAATRSQRSTLRKSRSTDSIGPLISPRASSLPKTADTSSLGKIFSAVRSRSLIRCPATRMLIVLDIILFAKFGCCRESGDHVQLVLEQPLDIETERSY